ncbi:MAG: dockerin type I domain-containing protein [Planctomycetota bacterium]|nr:dockerin type I domain-containing protein [Planctomycetota bacterium]
MSTATTYTMASFLSATLILSTLSVAAPFPAEEVGADGHGWATPPNASKPIEPSLSELYGVKFIPVPSITLGAIDVDAALIEDEMTPQPAPLRFAIPRPVNVSVADGQWIDVPGGRLWRLAVTATDSTCNRLHLSGLSLGDGESLFLVNTGDIEQFVGPLTSTGSFETGEAWGLFAQGQSSRIEWFVPDFKDRAELPFTSVEISHGYRDVFSAAIGADEGGVAGNCHNAPLCFPTWANQSAATVRLAFGGGYLCSGQVMATTAADATPYCSTANHCISTQADANSCQYLFNFRNSSCGGGISAGTTVTGGNLTDTWSTSDCTLMMIRAEIPATTYFVGWLTTTAANAAASTCLHHPGGAAQAISFGTKISNPICGSTSYWTGMSWTNGITEPGSSGSGIYRNSDQKLYGVLTCGSSSCQNPGGDDGYGRWDAAVSATGGNFAAFLAAGSDDAQEPNDTCTAPRAIVPGTPLTGLVCKSTDPDFYSFTVPSGSTATMSLTFIDANGDIDAELFTTCGATAVASALGNANNENFTWTNTGAATTAVLRVFLFTDTRNEYSMTVSVSTPPDPPPANNECAGAVVLPLGSTTVTTALATNSAIALATTCIDGGTTVMYKDVWYRLTAPFTGTMTVSTCNGSAFDSRLAVYPTTCPTASTQSIACDDDTTGCSGGSTSVTWNVTVGTQYLVRLGGKTSMASGFATLTVTGVPAAPPCPEDLNGDGTVDGADLALMLNYWGSAAGDVNGSGTTDGTDLGILLSGWGAC